MRMGRIDRGVVSPRKSGGFSQKTVNYRLFAIDKTVLLGVVA